MTFDVISPDDIARGLIDGLLLVYKRLGETPLQTLDRIRVKYPVLKDVALSYAGRLDPAAEGLMLVLSGKANKSREDFLGLDKEYECEVLLGISTDTGDLLGLINTTKENIDQKIDESSVSEVLSLFVGKHTFTYPVFSSKTVKGKPLFAWFKEGKINDIEIPTTDVSISSIKLLSLESIGVENLVSRVKNIAHTVTGDFRQEAILADFDKLSIKNSSSEFYKIKIHVSCSSGTYMRTLAEKIGEKFDMPALAYSIKRIKVGDFDMSDKRMLLLD